MTTHYIQIQEIVPSKIKTKRFQATFTNGAVTHFGSRGKNAFIDHKDKIRRERYFKRHRKDLEIRGNPFKAKSLQAAFLTWYLLWQTEDLDVNKYIYNLSLKKWSEGVTHHPLYMFNERVGNVDTPVEWIDWDIPTRYKTLWCPTKKINCNDTHLFHQRIMIDGTIICECCPEYLSDL